MPRGIVLLAILLIAYYAGGYVAGRMSRFSGPKQGLGVWIIALLVTVIVSTGAVLGAGSQRLEPAQPPAHPRR